MTGHVGGAHAAGMANERMIIDEIRARYRENSVLPHPDQVAISERAGTVTLRGTVSSPRDRRMAADIAKSVAEVRDVEDNLSLDPRDRWEDHELRGRALQALIFADDVPDDQIDVGVSAAWITLKGEVKHQSESNAAFEAVTGLPGAGGITNEIKVVAPAGR
jgi:osmotically-inducible protein OsmY